MTPLVERGRRPRRAVRRRCDVQPSGTSVDVDRDAWLESHGSAGRDVEAVTARRGAVECERRVGFGEVVVRSDLHGPVAAVLDVQRHDRTPDIEFDRRRRARRFAGNHIASTIGSCNVTSLVPSGNVASTCTSGSSPARPPSRRRVSSTCRPACIRSATDRPSRAPSSTQSVRIATDSGWFSSSPRCAASAGDVGGDVDQQPLLLVGCDPHGVSFAGRAAPGRLQRGSRACRRRPA